MPSECENVDSDQDDPTTSARDSIVSVAKGEVAGIVHSYHPGPRDETGRRTRVGWEVLAKYFEVAPDAHDYVIKYWYTSERHEDPLPHWCGIFANWVLRQAGAPVGTWAGGIAAVSGMEHTTDPKAGDVGILTGSEQHHVVITEVDGQAIKTVEGNWMGGQVLEWQRAKSDFAYFFTAYP